MALYPHASDLKRAIPIFICGIKPFFERNGSPLFPAYVRPNGAPPSFECVQKPVNGVAVGAVKMATFYAATASAGVAGRVAQAQDGTHSACETAGRAAFDANRASFFSPDAVVNYTIAWGASNSETVTVLMSLSE